MIFLCIVAAKVNFGCLLSSAFSEDMELEAAVALVVSARALLALYRKCGGKPKPKANT